MGAQDISKTWKDVVREALVDLGGVAHLRDINVAIQGHPKTRTNPTWRDTIRRVVRQYAIFEPVPPERSGKYRLVELPAVEAMPQSFRGREKDDHGIAQGMLLALGRLYGYETFAPAMDRTTREFQGKKLADYTTVIDCAEFSGRASVKIICQIDAIWLTNDIAGAYPVYAFEVENSTRVRSGIDRLVEIPERFGVSLYVVAPGKEEQRLFEKLKVQNRYRRFIQRLQFRNYEELGSLYNSAVEHARIREQFGIRQFGL